MARYCGLLYQHLGSYQAVARQVDLDRRTVRKYVEATASEEDAEAEDSLRLESAAKV